MKTIQSELALFQKTDNSAHARWVANELLKIESESNLSNIEQLHDVTVGRASRGDIKSGLLWSTIALIEAREALLRNNYIEIIRHATGGNMNKAYSDTSQIKTVIDDHTNRIVEAEKAEAVRDYEASLSSFPMDDTTLHGVLNMPTDIWSNDPLDQIQRHGRYVEASKRIKHQDHQINIMREALQQIRMLRRGSILDCAIDIAENALSNTQEQGK